MTPKEKAKELYKKFNEEIQMDSSIYDTVEDANRKCMVDHKASVNCALIAVELTITTLKDIEYITRGIATVRREFISDKIFEYRKVKQEITRL